MGQGSKRAGIRWAGFRGALGANDNPDGSNEEQGSDDLQREVVVREDLLADQVGIGKLGRLFVSKALVNGAVFRK